MGDFRDSRRGFVVENKDRRRDKLSMPPKPKRWSHQDDLTAAVGRGISIQLDSGFVQGTLLASDAFTIKIEHQDKLVFTYFKHSISRFEIGFEIV